MAKYKVHLVYETSVTVTVEADNENEAEQKALLEVNSDKYNEELLENMDLEYQDDPELVPDKPVLGMQVYDYCGEVWHVADYCQYKDAGQFECLKEKYDTGAFEDLEQMGELDPEDYIVAVQRGSEKALFLWDPSGVWYE